MKTIHEYILEGLRLGKNRDSKQSIDKVVNSFEDLYEMITRFVNWRYGAENKIRIGGITGKESWRITSAMLNTVDVKHGFEISLLDESNKIQKILRVGELVGLDNIVFQIKERNNLGKLDTFHMCGVNSQFSNRFFKPLKLCLIKGYKTIVFFSKAVTVAIMHSLAIYAHTVKV